MYLHMHVVVFVGRLRLHCVKQVYLIFVAIFVVVACHFAWYAHFRLRRLGEHTYKHTLLPPTTATATATATASERQQQRTLLCCWHIATF